MSNDIKIASSDGLVEIAFKVCTALDRAGIKVVLTGGSAAAVYAPEQVQSSDLDFIIEFYTEIREIEPVIFALGYEPKGRIYANPAVLPTLDFPDNQLLIGDEFVKDTALLERDNLVLRILTPYDCVRDRLIGFFAWDDYKSLDAAVAVAKSNPIDLEQLEKWARRIGSTKELAMFERRLRGS